MVGDEEPNDNLCCAGVLHEPERAVEPSMFRVLLVNDDATPMEFVVRVLVEIFQTTQKDAERIMLTTHHMGTGLCGMYTRQDADGLVSRVADLALLNNHPLQCLMEPDGLIESDFPLALKEWRVLTCQGQLSDLPAFVLEAGGGWTREAWHHVQQCLRRRTLVVSYDRAGLGWNAEWPLDAGAGGVAARLEPLLVRAAIPPPYILVGHSLGGLFAQYYATRHLRDVAGLVLVDPTPSGDANIASMAKQFAPGGLHWNPFSAVSREVAAIGTSQILVRRHPVAPEIPILVVSAGSLPPGAPDELRQLSASLLQQHKDAAARSLFGRHVVMPQADHGSIVLNPQHATELTEHILDFAEAFCRTRPVETKAAGA